MKLPDLLTMKSQEPKTFLQFAASQLQGTKPVQEDYFVNFNDECFIVADGVGSLPHGDDASREAAETAIWAYKLIRQRPYYWEEKKAFLARIFRSTNLSLWQKRKLPQYNGMATTLDVVIAGDRNFWFGHVGDSSLFLYRGGILTKLTTDHVNASGRLTKYIGQRRLGLRPQIGSGKFAAGDTLLLLTNGITKALATDAILSLMRAAETGNLSPDESILTLLAKAQAERGDDNMTACAIRYLGYSR